VMTTRFPATEYAMAKAWREWPVVTWVSAICTDNRELEGIRWRGKLVTLAKYQPGFL